MCQQCKFIFIYFNIATAGITACTCDSYLLRDNIKEY